MKLNLVVLTPGPSEGRVIPINVPQFIIGRDSGCQLRPASIHISKRHCALLRNEDRVFVRDFGSTNGTFVNDRQIKGEIEVLDGDRLRVGPLLFGVQLEPASVNRLTPPPPTKTQTQKQQPNQTSSPLAGEPASAADKEEDAAALLLAMKDNDAPEAGPQTEVPEGSTVFDLPVPIVADKEKDKAKQASGDTSTAAKSILDKYLKRPRPG